MMVEEAAGRITGAVLLCIIGYKLVTWIWRKVGHRLSKNDKK